MDHWLTVMLEGEDIINIYRPNPNAKEVYARMEFQEELKIQEK